MPDDPKIDMDLILKLHAGLEVLKSRQSEINRRITVLETGIETVEQGITSLKTGDGGKPEWMQWVWQGVAWAIGITVAVTVGRMFGVEVSF